MADNDILADEERPWDSVKLEGANYKRGCLLLVRSLVEPPPVEPSPAKGKGKSKYKKGGKACDKCGERRLDVHVVIGKALAVNVGHAYGSGDLQIIHMLVYALLCSMTSEASYWSA